MNFGACPYCDQLMGMFCVPNRTPAYAKVQCSQCGKDVWYRFSRVDPQAWRVEDFEQQYTVDEAMHTITRKEAV